MVFKLLLFVCALSVVSSQIVNQKQGWTPILSSAKSNEESSPSQAQPEHTDRVGRFMNLKKLYTSEVETNEIDVEKKEETENPDEALTGLYSECVMTFSLPCLQKKFLVFLDRLGRMDSFSIIGDFLSVKRTNKETTKPITEKAIEARMNYHKSEEDLELLVDYAIERFFNNHKLRIKLPFGLSVAESGASTGRSSAPESNAIDIGFARGFSEGRGKKKKMLMMMMMMMKMKMLAILPMIAMMIKLKALKALILSKMALFLAMLSLLKKKMMKDDKHKIVIIHDPHHGSSGGGHGHDSYGPPSGGGWSSGGDSYSSGGDHGGGWGRSWQSQPDAQTLAYRGHNITNTT